MTEKDDCTLDCCDHKFCFKCIHTWANEKKNQCPLCKGTIKTISRKNEEGNEISINVEKGGEWDSEDSGE